MFQYCLNCGRGPCRRLFSCTANFTHFSDRWQGSPVNELHKQPKRAEMCGHDLICLWPKGSQRRPRPPPVALCGCERSVIKIEGKLSRWVASSKTRNLLGAAYGNCMGDTSCRVAFCTGLRSRVCSTCSISLHAFASPETSQCTGHGTLLCLALQRRQTMRQPPMACYAFMFAHIYFIKTPGCPGLLCEA